MPTSRYNLPNAYTDGVTPFLGSTAAALANILDQQAGGGLELLSPGVVPNLDGTLTALQVTAATGLGISVVPGRALAFSTTYRACFINLPAAVPLTLTANSTLYVFAAIDVRAANDSRATGLPVLTVQAGATLSGGVPLAVVVTGATGITSITDLRRYVAPLAVQGAWDSNRAFVTGDLVTSGGTSWLALLPSLNSLPALGNANWEGLGTVNAIPIGSPAGGALTGTFPNPGLGAHAATHAVGGSDAITPAAIGAAPLASPALTGTPTAPTVAGSTDSSATLATTAFVQAVLAAFQAAYPTHATLRAWTLAGAYSLTSGTYNTNEVLTSGTVVWPDGRSGTYTTDAIDSANNINAYHLTYTDGTTVTTITQPLMTRDVAGSVTAQPALTVAP